MEPKITCLDSATWVGNFNPADVVVGAVISFAAPPECGLGNVHVAHRVVDIREDDGVYSYWPKGDALADADGCWVPHTNVYGYLIELSKDAYAENSGLRNRVNAATAERDATYALFRAAEAVYVQRHQQYCGYAPDACRLDAAGLAELNGLYAEMLRLYRLPPGCVRRLELCLLGSVDQRLIRRRRRLASRFGRAGSAPDAPDV